MVVFGQLHNTAFVDVEFHFPFYWPREKAFVDLLGVFGGQQAQIWDNKSSNHLQIIEQCSECV